MYVPLDGAHCSIYILTYGRKFVEKAFGHLTYYTGSRENFYIDHILARTAGYHSLMVQICHQIFPGPYNTHAVKTEMSSSWI